MPGVIRCSECDTLIRLADDDSPKDRKCPQCGAANASTELLAEWSKAEDAEAKKTVRHEEGMEGEPLASGMSAARDCWIPLAMIVASVVVRVVVFLLVTYGTLSDAGIQTMAFRLILSYVVALSVYEAALELAFGAVLGVVAMLIQSRILGTTFGAFGTAILKVVALMVFTPTIAAACLFLLICLYEENGAMFNCIFLGPIFVGVFFMLTKWFFDLDISDALTFSTIVLLGPIVASQSVEWGIENAGPFIDALREYFQSPDG